MRNAFILLFILIFSAAVFAQQKPITQPEFVKLIYAAQSYKAAIDGVIEALRKRGIDFELNDGLRTLVRSKSKNNEELKRELEEAERRRVDPESAALPSAEESANALEKAKTAALNALAEMPDFVVKESISRSAAYAGTGTWKPLDQLLIAVSYSTEEGEQYRLLARDGVRVDSERKNSYSGLDGATSGGEFVEDLKKIFSKESQTEFEPVTSDTLRGRRTIVFEYTIKIENNKYGGVGLKGPVYRSSPAGEKGRIWIDRETFQVLRISYKLTDIAPSFPVKSVTKSIDYDIVDISGEKFLLPMLSDFRGTVAEADGRSFDSRNVIRFRDYQKFGTDVIIGDEDLDPDAPIPTDPEQ
jgi:hypothetical protein